MKNNIRSEQIKFISNLINLKAQLSNNESDKKIEKALSKVIDACGEISNLTDDEQATLSNIMKNAIFGTELLNYIFFSKF